MAIWKDIKGYEGLYQVSDEGDVRSLDRKTIGKDGRVCYFKGRNLKKTKMNIGYLKVTLVKNGENNQFLVHRLVANAFISNPHNLPYINHKDEDKTNNSVSNLEFCTPEYNNNYGTRKSKIAKSQERRVNEYTLDGVFIKRWDSMKQIEEECGFHNQNISSCCRGKYKQAYGRVWKYAS